MNLFLRGRSRYPDNLPPPRLPPYGSVPVNPPVEQNPLNGSPQRDGTLLDNSQTGLSEPSGSLPTLFVRVLKDGIIFELPYDVAIERDDVQILHGYERVSPPFSLEELIKLGKIEALYVGVKNERKALASKKLVEFLTEHDFENERFKLPKESVTLLFCPSDNSLKSIEGCIFRNAIILELISFSFATQPIRQSLAV